MITPEKSHELMRIYAATRCGDAFQELVEGWTGMVYGTALRIARGQETLAEDVTQAVFSRLATAPERVKDARALGAWLHAAATGLTLDALRLEVRRRRREKISHHLNLDTRELPAPDREDELPSEIDGALRRLPLRDSQLLLLRFWHQQDWRSIGRNFGLSEDAAQKRMSRALERLRHILARRGITSTSGILSAVLAGTVPRDLPAATVLKIISTTQIPTSVGAASTILTTVLVNTKTKITIAAVALLLAAAVPVIHQKVKIAALPEETQSQQPRAPVATSKKPRVAPFAEEMDDADELAAKRTQIPDGPVSADSSDSDAITVKDGQRDFEDMNRGKMAEKLAVLRNLLSATPEQALVIAKALEIGQSKIKISPPNVMVIRATPEDIRRMEDAIAAVLTPEQHKEYEDFRAEERANDLEVVANRELSNLQSMTTLSQEQKDRVFAAFSEIAATETHLPMLDPDLEQEAIKVASEARWAARLEALSAILTAEQMALYQKHGNPYKRGTGG